MVMILVVMVVVVVVAVVVSRVSGHWLGCWSQKFVCAAHRWHCRHFVGKFFL